MKNKVVRRVSATKKTVSKKILTRKKKFSPKAWLVGGLTLFLAAALGYYFLQPKPLKVLELAGKIEDYIVPNPVDINQLVSSKTPKSDIPELNAAAAAVQAKKAGLSDTAQKQAAKKAAEDTIRQNAEIAVRQKSTSTDPKKIEEEKAAIIEKARDAIRDEAPVIADKAMEAASRVKVNDDGTITIDPTVGSNSPITQGGSCSAANGAQVLSGSTVIGDVEKTEGDNYNKNKVYECLNGVWKFANRYCGTGEAMLNCDITLKPTYALKEGQKNCYQGSTIVGDGQVTDTQDGKKQCKDGQFVATKQLNGQYLSEADYSKKFQELMDSCKNNGGSWQQVKAESSDWVCGKGNNDTCGKIGKVFNPATQGCVDPGSVSDKADTKTTTPYSKAGCDNARDKNKEDCIQSADNPLLWVIVPRGTKPSVNSGVPAQVSSEVNAGNTNYKGSQECENALKLKGAGYTCEPIAGGIYYKLTPTTELPSTRTYDANATSGFGSSNTQPEIIAKDTQSEAIAACEALKKQYSGGDCLEQGLKDGKYQVNFVPPTNTNANYNDSDSSYSNNGRKVDATTDCFSSEKPVTRRGNAEDGGGIYCVPKEIEKGSLRAGDSCDGKNDLCSSGDCRNIENQEGERGWYCMSEQSYINRTWADLGWKYSIIGTLPAYTVQVMRGLFWVDEKSLPNGAFCFGKSNACSSGYCASNRTFDTCEVNPFTAPTQSQAVDTNLSIDLSGVENISNAGADCWSTTTSGTSDKPRCRDICPDFNGDGVGESSEKPGSGGVRTCNSEPNE